MINAIRELNADLRTKAKASMINGINCWCKKRIRICALWLLLAGEAVKKSVDERWKQKGKSLAGWDGNVAIAMAKEFQEDTMETIFRLVTDMYSEGEERSLDNGTVIDLLNLHM